jgi:hypothetical protein
MKTLSPVFLLVLGASVATAQWVQTNGPYGGYVGALAVSEGNLFAATQDMLIDGTAAGMAGGGVFFSSNNGTSWTAVNNGLRDRYGSLPEVRAFAVLGMNIFTGQGGVVLSTDNGANWIAANKGFPVNEYGYYQTVNCFAVSEADLFAGTYGGGVFLSTDNGANWTAVNGGLPRATYDSTRYASILCLSVKDTNLFAGTEGGGVFLSTNSGASWTAVNSGLMDLNIHALAVSGTNLFATTWDGVFLSTNNGLSWSNANAPFSDFNQMVQLGSNLFAATWEGVFLSTNNGSSWSEVDSGLANKKVLALAVDGTYLYAGTCPCGVFRSTDYGKSWTAANSGLVYPFVSSLAVGPGGALGSNVFAGTYGGVIYQLSDHEADWSAVFTTTGSVQSLAFCGSNLLAGAYEGIILLRTGDGRIWEEVYDDGPSWSASSFAVDAGKILAGSGRHALVSTDSGKTWLATTLRDGGMFSGISSVAVSGANLFVGSYRDGVFRSTNNGTNWVALNSGLPRLRNDSTAIVALNALTVCGGNLFAGTSAGVFLSTNNGEYWTEVNSGLPLSPWDTTSIARVDAFAESGGSLFAGTSAGVFLSTNNGTTWTAANTGLPTNPSGSYPSVNCFAISGTSLFAGTRLGIWRRPLSEMVTSAERATELPKRFALDQNYPNPFNPATSITYQLPTTSHVTLIVYDLLGREVAELVNENKQAGVHSVQFEAVGLSSGVYFYRMQAGTYTSTRKLILVK